MATCTGASLWLSDLGKKDVVESNRNASRAKLLTLGVGVKIDVPEQDVVDYDFSGLTDMGGKERTKE